MREQLAGRERPIIPESSVSRRRFLIRAVTVAGGAAAAPILLQQPASCSTKATSGAQGGTASATPPKVDEGDLREVTTNILCEGKCGKTVYTGELADGCTIATEMKHQAAEYLSQGMTAEQVLDQFARDFGEDVLASPTKEGINLVPWFLPAVGVGVGVVAAAKAMANWRENASRVVAQAPPETDDEMQRRIDDEVLKDL